MNCWLFMFLFHSFYLCSDSITNNSFWWDFLMIFFQCCAVWSCSWHDSFLSMNPGSNIQWNHKINSNIKKIKNNRYWKFLMIHHLHHSEKQHKEKKWFFLELSFSNCSKQKQHYLLDQTDSFHLFWKSSEKFLLSE